MISSQNRMKINDNYLDLAVVFGRIVLFDNEIKFINIDETPSIGQKATD